jgi:SAM-dependent methyltransferase
MAAGSEHDSYSYEPFTRHRLYETVNRALVEEGIHRLPVPAARGRTIVDLSCGTGAITLMVIEALRSRGLDATIIAVEPSSEALAQAERPVAGAGYGRSPWGDQFEVFPDLIQGGGRVLTLRLRRPPPKRAAELRRALRQAGPASWSASRDRSSALACARRPLLPRNAPPRLAGEQRLTLGEPGHRGRSQPWAASRGRLARSPGQPPLLSGALGHA